jgi:hypothetical protein
VSGETVAGLKEALGFDASEVIRVSTVDMTTPRRTWPTPHPESEFQIYLIRDVETGKLLKVGSAKNFNDRLAGPGNLDKIEPGQRVEAEVLEFKRGSDRSLIESQIRAKLRQRGHQLLWDDSNMPGYGPGEAKGSSFRESP